MLALLHGPGARRSDPRQPGAAAGAADEPRDTAPARTAGAAAAAAAAVMHNINVTLVSPVYGAARSPLCSTHAH
jgi:hypothetical protein